METKVFITDKNTAIKITDDPDIKRKGEATYHDAGVLGFGEGVLVVVKGPAEVFALEVLKDLKEFKKGAEVLKKLAEAEESSACGVGALFG
ncbi:MAG TPA: hypothetical protein ENN60_01590 [archaeon]|nr:hypothetical protein [archaeon]